VSGDIEIVGYAVLSFLNYTIAQHEREDVNVTSVDNASRALQSASTIRDVLTECTFNNVSGNYWEIRSPDDSIWIFLDIEESRFGLHYPKGYMSVTSERFLVIGIARDLITRIGIMENILEKDGYRIRVNSADFILNTWIERINNHIDNGNIFIWEDGNFEIYIPELRVNIFVDTKYSRVSIYTPQGSVTYEPQE